MNCSKIIVTSGFRCVTHDKNVGGSGTGQHTKGTAADICCYGQDGNPISSKIVCCTAQDIGFTGIANINESYQYTHVDVRTGSKWYGNSASSLVTHTENDIKQKYTIWLAHWCDSTNYSGAYGIWQHSCKGKVDGISGDVDLDKCYVNYPERIKAKGLNGYGDIPTPDDSVSVEVTVDGKKYSGKLNKA